MNNAQNDAHFAARFSSVTTWVFDLDQTLYHPSARLFDQIAVKMNDWLIERLHMSRQQADTLRREYWRRHGNTLAGLMLNHGIEPGPYLDAVHEIDLSHLEPDPELAGLIRALSGRKIVYTNGPALYAARVLTARGLDDLFDAVYSVEDADFRAKPSREAYETVFTRDGFDRQQAAMFEDSVENLLAPHEMGMRCIHVADAPAPAPHVHFHTSDLSAFLLRITCI